MIDEIFELLGEISIGSKSRRKERRCQHCGKIAFGVVALVLGFVFYMFPVWETNGIVADESKALCSVNEYPGNGNDAWGNELVYRTFEVEQPYLATKCEVRSAGRDAEYMTDDDIIKTVQTIHVSRTVGRAAGEKARGLMSEFMDAVKGSPPVKE